MRCYRHPRVTRLLPLFIVLFASALLLPWLGRPFDANETNAGWYFAAISRNFAEHGLLELRGCPLLYTGLDDTRFGFPYLTHPPGTFWFYALFGPEEWKMRLGSLLATAVGALGLFALARRRFGAPSAALAACLYCAFPATAVYAQLTYETVVSAFGLWMLVALTALRDTSAERPWRRRVLQVTGFVCAFGGTWMDWTFASYCLAAAPLAWCGLRFRATIGTLLAPAIGAVAAAAGVFAWKAWLKGAPALPKLDAAVSVGDTVSGVIAERPDAAVYWRAFGEHLVDCYTTPMLAACALGTWFLLRRDWRLGIGMLAAGIFVPLLFGQHVVNEHRLFFAYFAPLFALLGGGLHVWLTRFPKPAIAIGTLALLAIPTWSSLDTRIEGATPFFRDFGETLSAAAAETTDLGVKRYDVVHNGIAYGCYLDTERIQFPPFLDPTWVASGMNSIPRERGIRYLWLDATYDPPIANTAGSPMGQALAAYLAQFPRKRVTDLEYPFSYDPTDRGTGTIREAWLYTLREAFPDEVIVRIREAADATMAEQEIPGMTIAVRAPNGAIWTEGFGLADIENEVPATADTIYRLASISKPMTAVVAMKLAEDGKLDLDAPVQTYLKDYPEKRWPITTRDLLGHLAGVRHYEGNVDEVRSNKHYTGVIDALEIFRDDPLMHEPRSKYRYTTYGYNLAGAVTQRAGGAKFVKLLEKLVFAPAGMTTIRADDARAIIAHRAQGYRIRAGKLTNADPVDTSNKIPGGGLCSRAIDLVRFGIALLDDTLVSRASRDVMWTEQATTDGKKTGYGLGFAVREHEGRTIVGHSGAQPRVRTRLRIWPAEGTVVAIMCNLEGRKLVPLTNRIGALLHDVK